MRNWLIKLLGGFTAEEMLEGKEDYKYLLDRTIQALEGLNQAEKSAPAKRPIDPEPVDTRRTPFTIKRKLLEQHERNIIREANREAEKLEAVWRNRE